MSSLQRVSFFDAEAQSLQEVIEEFGEQFRYAPYRTMQVNFPTGPDPTRPSHDFDAVFERNPKNLMLGLEEVRVSTRHLCLTTLVCYAPHVRQGDRITHKLTNEMFEVTDVKPDGMSGVEISLVQLGRQS